MRNTAYLLIHGFGGSPAEVDYLSRYLRGAGLDVYDALLAGHGGGKRELHGSSPDDWVSSAENTLSELLREYRSVTIIGFSMGGLIGLRFASLPGVSRIVLINTPIYYWNFKIILCDVISGLRQGGSPKLGYYRGAMFASSIKSDIDFLKLLHKSKRYISSAGKPQIDKPVLVVQCMDDETVRHRSAVYLKEKLGGSAEMRRYEGGCHQVFSQTGLLRDKICGDIYGFLTGEAVGAEKI